MHDNYILHGGTEVTYLLNEFHMIDATFPSFEAPMQVARGNALAEMAQKFISKNTFCLFDLFHLRHQQKLMSTMLIPPCLTRSLTPEMCQHILNIRDLVYFTVRCSDEYMSNTNLLYSCHLRFNHNWLADIH